MIQTNLREIDMLDIDAEQYVKELKEFKATVAMINVGGIIASYKTELPFHFQSPFLKGDSLEKIIEVCHREGIKVMARNDFSKIRRSIYEQHPEWAYRNSEGVVVDYNGDIHTCVNGEYQTVYVHKIMGEILDKLDIDGVFFNMGGYQVMDYSYKQYGICHCDSCKQLFRKTFGLNLPDKADMNDPNYRKYKVFQRNTLDKYEIEMVDYIHSKRKDIAINKYDLHREESNTEYQRELPHWQYSGSSNTRWVRNTYPETRASSTTVDFIGYCYRHVAVNPVQQELRLWQNLANTGDLDYYLIGRLDNHQDKSGYAGIKRVFDYHARNEDSYLNLKSQADVLLVRKKGWGGDNEDRGWIRFLTEKHFLFDEVLVEGISNVDIEKYKAIVLSDAKYLSDIASKKLDLFVKAGGTLISTGETGLYDEDFESRDVISLKSMGIKGSILKRDDMRSGMFLIDDISAFPTFQKWQTELLYFGDHYLYCNYDDSVKKCLKLIPPHNFGPPERCYYEQVTDYPGFTVNQYGNGRAIHIPWWPGTLFHREGYVNTSAFVGDLLENIAELTSIATNASPMVEITMSHKDDDNLIQLVNNTGHYGTTFYEPVDLYNIWVEIPFADKPTKCISLQDGKEIAYKYENGKLRIELEKVSIFEAIKITKI
jgi:hypothetical protein